MKNKHGAILISDERYCASDGPGANYDTPCGISTSDGMFTPVFGDTWRARMAGAPERTIKATERKIEAVAA